MPTAALEAAEAAEQKEHILCRSPSPVAAAAQQAHEVFITAEPAVKGSPAPAGAVHGLPCGLPGAPCVEFVASRTQPDAAIVQCEQQSQHLEQRLEQQRQQLEQQHEQRRQQRLQQERQWSEEPPQLGEATSEGLQQQRQPVAALPVRAVAARSIAGQVSALPGAAPAAASVLGLGSSGGDGGSGSIALLAAALRQRSVEGAIAAFEAADGSAKSMLRPLNLLRQAGHGGQVLQVCRAYQLLRCTCWCC